MTMKRKTRVAVLFGGRSVEHEISVITGLQLIQAIDPDAYEVTPVYIAPSGAWYTGDELLNRDFYRGVPGNLNQLVQVTLLPTPGINGLVPVELGLLGCARGGLRASVIPIDVFLPTFHGQYGEDGCVQGLFELADVPYTGSNVVASAITMNKYTCKMFLRAHGIPVLPARIIQREEARTDILKVTKEIVNGEGFTSFPLFVKPCNLGSSIGISRVAELGELAPALAKVFRYDTAAIVEPCVTNLMEINVSIREHNGVHASVVEIPVSQSGVLSYEEKYLRDGGKKSGPSSGMASLTRVIDPQDLDPSIKESAISFGTQAFSLLGCSGVARLDFIVDLATGSLYFNELNALPGSCSFYLWVRSDPRVLYTDLISDTIETALAHHATKASLDRDIGLRALR